MGPSDRLIYNNWSISWRARLTFGETNTCWIISIGWRTCKPRFSMPSVSREDPYIPNNSRSRYARSFWEGLPLQYRLQMIAGTLRKPVWGLLRGQVSCKERRIRHTEIWSSCPDVSTSTNPIRPLSPSLAHSRRDRFPSRYRSEESFGDGRGSSYPRTRDARPSPSLTQTTRVITSIIAPINGADTVKGHEIEECKKREYNNFRIRQEPLRDERTNFGQ